MEKWNFLFCNIFYLKNDKKWLMWYKKVRMLRLILRIFFWNYTKSSPVFGKHSLIYRTQTDLSLLRRWSTLHVVLHFFTFLGPRPATVSLFSFDWKLHISQADLGRLSLNQMLEIPRSSDSQTSTTLLFLSVMTRLVSVVAGAGAGGRLLSVIVADAGSWGSSVLAGTHSWDGEASESFSSVEYGSRSWGGESSSDEEIGGSIINHIHILDLEEARDGE